MPDLKIGSIERDEYEFLRSFDGSSCCGFSAGDCDGTPSGKIAEALMMIAYRAVDEHGLLLGYRLPPAVAVAITKAFESGDPVGFALEAIAKMKGQS